MTSAVHVLDPSPAELETRVVAWPDRARELRIVDDKTMEQAGELLREIKTLRREVDTTFDPIVSKAHEAHKEACAQKKRHAQPLDEAEDILKRSLASYREEQERRAEEERRRLEEEARQLEGEQRFAEMEAALDAGDEQAAEEIVARPVLVAPPLVRIAKPQGVSYREEWKFEVTSLRALVMHCAKNPADLNLLIPNPTAIRQLVNARKSGCQIPGVRVWKGTGVAAKGR
jgi:gas vesicle protein